LVVTLKHLVSLEHLQGLANLERAQGLANLEPIQSNPSRTQLSSTNRLIRSHGEDLMISSCPGKVLEVTAISANFNHVVTRGIIA
jgi:hypothetical protein